jgi:hypothetical protein
MKQYYYYLYNYLWKPARNFIVKLIKGRDDDDNHFNHPWAVV